MLKYAIKRISRNSIYHFFLMRKFHLFKKIIFAPDREYFKRETIDTGVLFIHIPKAAGNSVTQTIWGLDSIELYAHKKAVDFQCIDAVVFNNLFKFTFVRDPVSRFVSAFEFLRYGGMTERDKEWANIFISSSNNCINTFISRIDSCRFFRHEVLNWIHFEPQKNYLCDHNGLLLVDYVGKYENINYNIINILDIIGVEKQLVHVNKTLKKSTSNCLTKESRNFIKKLYRDDMIMFGYQ